MPAKRVATRTKAHPAKRWSAKVNTDSTHPEKGLFTKNATTIAHALATKRVSPQGPASGMRMLNFYINRAGKNLGKDRLADLRRAKTILSELIAHHSTRANSNVAPKKKSTSKKAAKKPS